MTAPALPPIGARLREVRLQRGMTVRGLARIIDVSASLISQIETGKSRPSVSTLFAITAALGVSIEEVFGSSDEVTRTMAALPNGDRRPALTTPSAVLAAQALDTVAERVAGSATSPLGLGLLSGQRRVGPVVTPADREVLHLDSGVTWELLGQLPEAQVDFLRITYAPGGSSSATGVLMRHSGTEWGHVLTGQLTLTLGFETYVLNPGDSVSFDCSTPHSYANHGVEPAIGVWFVARHFN